MEAVVVHQNLEQVTKTIRALERLIIRYDAHYDNNNKNININNNINININININNDETTTKHGFFFSLTSIFYLYVLILYFF